MSNVILTNLVDGELVSNYALFKHPTNQTENLGELFFDMPVFNSETEKYEIRNIYGFDVQGTGIENITISDDEDELSALDRLNPSKVFWFLYRKAKQKLCPSCMSN